MRIAAFQRTAVFDEPERVIELIVKDLLWAEMQGIDIAIFPECFLQGHTYDGNLAKRRALSLTDPLMEKLVSHGSSKATAIVGYFERRDEAIYNSAVVLEAGRLKGNYAKANPIEDDCLPGQEFPVWSRDGWTFGINICSDLSYPQAADRITNNGAKLICCPLNMMLRPHKAEKWREPALAALRDCARRTGAWVVSADVVGHNPEGWTSFGCSAIVSPSGEVVAQAPEHVKHVVVFDLPASPGGALT